MRKIAINQKHFPTMVNVYGCRCVLKSHYKQSEQPQSNKMQKKITEGAKSWGDVMCMKA